MEGSRAPHDVIPRGLAAVSAPPSSAALLERFDELRGIAMERAEGICHVED